MHITSVTPHNKAVLSPSARTAHSVARRKPKRYVSSMTRAMLLLSSILVSVQAPASEQTQMAFTSIVFNYWCQAGSPPRTSRDLSLVVDLEELDEYLDFDPDQWIQSVRFEMEGKLQKITFPSQESAEGASITTTSSYSTHECDHSEET